jgi:putative transposase
MVDDEVEAMSSDFYTMIQDGDRHLSLRGNAARMKFEVKSVLVDTLEKTGAKLSVNRDCRTNSRVAEILEFQHHFLTYNFLGFWVPKRPVRFWVAGFVARERGAGRPPKDDRNFIEAVLWWRRTGVPWRDLPEAFGPWKTIFNRFDRWAKKGKWQGLFEALKTDIDGDWQSIDSTINRAHQHAAGAKGGLRSKRSAARLAG